MADYVLEGPKWGAWGLGTAGGTATWAVDSSIPGTFVTDLADAFADWSRIADIQFRQVASTAAAQIDLALGAIDGRGNVLGQANYSFTANTFTAATVEFDSGENWRASGGHVTSGTGFSFFLVALHEIGHAIGLDHYNAAAAVMNATLSAQITDLTTSDMNGIRALYGDAAEPPLVGLVDTARYLAANPDVAQAGMGAAEHYNTYGWHEGRDPNASFSTFGYLAANADVAKAGINPLTHYDSYGWKEGRDPSANFDNELYLAHNPDVRAAGIDPLLHYLQVGQAKGLATYAAIGKPTDLAAHPGFDAEYYLLANADVAKAALAVGGDTFAFAYRHYETYGWHEGRDPNAVFDTKGYLAAYGDVKAAGIDPLAHYHANGWREGRDPSAEFDTKAYESHNADVAAAQLDPMQHYLQYGAAEGRGAFGDGHFG